MAKTGNPGQWGDHYPSYDLVLEDIKDGLSHLIYTGDEIHGVFAVCPGPEPEYLEIFDGAWLNDEPYLAVHRVAGDGEVHGLFRMASDYVKSLSDNVRIDTHENNRVMQKVIEREGFVKCGIVYMADGTPRIAYQWVKK